jgi:hypothetical protein
MKRFLILIYIALISACQPFAANSVTSTPGEVMNLPSRTPTRKISISTAPFTPTHISVPSETSIPTETSTPLPAKLFNPADIPTFTPAEPVQCPRENPSVELDVKGLEEYSGSVEPNQQVSENLLAFLNTGGSLKSILPAYDKYYKRQINPFFKIQDVTGDGVPELIYPFAIWLDIFGCKDGHYELLFTDSYESDIDGVGTIIDVSDINWDGLTEVTVYFNGCLGNRCPIIRVYEWNGKEFYDLIANPFSPDGCSNLPTAPFDVKIQDIDNNGTKEIILNNSRLPQPDNDFPYRKETRICMWNGQNIVVYKDEFDAPYYRFQAVQDGDKAALAGEYDKAINFYQRTINDKKLQWFTQDRKWYDFWIYRSKYFPSFNEPIPTASPSMVEDPNEYPNLAAYAYYRIMLLYILQNKTAKAESIFNTLQGQFPTGSPGNYFAQIAYIFSQEYQPSMNVKSSCKKVIEYAQAHSLPTGYLGDSDHGVHSIEYTPETICPFR